MLYDIRLSIEYEYETPAIGGRHLLRMLPRAMEGIQRVIVSDIECTPGAAERQQRQDFFGNTVVSVRYDDRLEQEAFFMRARVERHAPMVVEGAPVSLQELQGQIGQIHSVSPDSPYHFISPSVLVSPEDAVTNWAMSEIGGARSVFEIAMRISSALHSQMSFDPESTAIETPLGEAFAARKGVCQDFTHIMIAALRALGIPAGYVSGFQRTNPPEGQDRLEGADAMHAWVRVWCGLETGWVEFDPTNNMLAGEDHVIVAYGRDYFDVAPIKGNIRLSGSQKSSQSVDMIPL